MKLLTTSALALFMFVLVGCADGNAPSPETDAVIANATNKVEANIEGMDCSGCSGAVVAAVEAIDGVEAASADVASGDVKVALSDDVDTDAKLLEIESVLAGLQDGKYTVKTITATYPANGEADLSEELNSNEPATEEPADEEPASDEQANASDEVFVTASYKVTGMDCSGCSSSIVEAVKAVDGVQKVEADHTTGAVSVAFEDKYDDKVKADEIKNVIAGLSDGKYTFNE